MNRIFILQTDPKEKYITYSISAPSFGVFGYDIRAETNIPNIRILVRNDLIERIFV